MALPDRLPYDLLKMIFKYLDIETLLNACLTSYDLNELASWALYTSITFNPDTRSGFFWYMSIGPPRNPIEALKRRPHLRNAVRNVIFCASANDEQDEKSERMSESAESCCEALALLPNVFFLQIRYCREQYEWELLSKLIPQLRSLRDLDLQGIEQTGELPHSTAVDINADLSPTAVLTFAKTSMAHKLRALVTCYEIEVPIQELSSSLNAFSRLTRLAVDYHRFSPGEICQLVAAVPSLREALFHCDLELELGNIAPTGAKHLTYIRIAITSPKDPPNEIQTLNLLVKCVAEKSQLERLDIIAARRKPKVLNGDPLLSHILPLHKKTLERLKIPDFHISKAKLRQLLSQCDRLFALWLGVSQELKAHLPDLLSKSKSLEKLRIYAVGTWRFMYAQALLCQTCPSLREFKVCSQKHRIRREKACWKGCWKYDDVLGQPIIVVDGPSSTGFRANIQYDPSYTGSFDEEEAEMEEETVEGELTP